MQYFLKWQGRPTSGIISLASFEKPFWAITGSCVDPTSEPVDSSSGLWAKVGGQKITQLSRYAGKLVYEAPAMRSAMSYEPLP